MKRITFVLAALFWTLASASVALSQTYGGSMETLQGALEYNRTNQAATWVSPDEGGSGTVTPVRTFENGGGQPCREFQQTIVIGGREQQGYGTACRQPDGTWKIVPGQQAATARTAEQRSTVYVRQVPPRTYSTYYPYAYPYYPYGYYDPWGYAYPYWFPFNLSLNFGFTHFSGRHFIGHSHRGHHFRGGHFHQGFKVHRGGFRR